MKTSTSKRERIVIGILIVIFIAVLSGMLWDVYGKNIFRNTSSFEISPTPTIGVQNITPKPTGKNRENKPTNPAKNSNSKAPNKQENISTSAYSTCLENTKDEPAAKDCCDCLSGDASLHKACRDAAATYDFSKNTVFKEFTIPSKLGRSGDYSVCTASGNQQQCKQCCESSSSPFVCGDFQYCRTACNNLSQ